MDWCKADLKRSYLMAQLSPSSGPQLAWPPGLTHAHLQSCIVVAYGWQVGGQPAGVGGITLAAVRTTTHNVPAAAVRAVAGAGAPYRLLGTGVAAIAPNPAALRPGAACCRRGVPPAPRPPCRCHLSQQLGRVCHDHTSPAPAPSVAIAVSLVLGPILHI